ncbi:hypothetical protein MMC06_004097 [Schaereria dolodes]|nr:hypothetical protein [Schaereria dolodes]
MPKSLAKVHKKIIKKGGNITSLHENSRDSQRLRRASARDDKLARVSAARAKVNQSYIQRVAFFQSAAKAIDQPIDIDETQSLIRRYIRRDYPELSKLQSERRPGRPTSAREDLLRQRMVTEEREHDIGFWIPDMVAGDNLVLLRKWNGEWTSLSTLKFVRIGKDGEKKESAFPPKGRS